MDAIVWIDCIMLENSDAIVLLDLKEVWNCVQYKNTALLKNGTNIVASPAQPRPVIGMILFIVGTGWNLFENIVAINWSFFEQVWTCF